MRQAYDYWQDQPGCFRRRGGVHVAPEGAAKPPRGWSRQNTRALLLLREGKTQSAQEPDSSTARPCGRAVRSSISVETTIGVVCLLSRRSVATLLHTEVELAPSRRAHARRGGSHGLEIRNGIQAMHRAGATTKDTRCRVPHVVALSCGPSLVVRQAVRCCHSLVWAGLTPAQPGAARRKRGSLEHAALKARSRCAVVAWLPMGGQVGSREPSRQLPRQASATSVSPHSYPSGSNTVSTSPPASGPDG